MKIYKTCLTVLLLLVSFCIYAQDTSLVKDFYKEKTLPPTEKNSLTETLFDRFIVFELGKLKDSDSIQIIIDSEKKTYYTKDILNNPETYLLKNGRVYIKSGKTSHRMDYKVTFYNQDQKIEEEYLAKEKFYSTKSPDVFKKIGRRPVMKAVERPNPEEENTKTPQK